MAFEARLPFSSPGSHREDPLPDRRLKTNPGAGFPADFSRGSADARPQGGRTGLRRVREAARPPRGSRRPGARAQLRALGDEVKKSEQELAAVEAELERHLLVIPNPPHASVPDGKDEKDNVVVRTWGEKVALGFAPKPHWELGEALGILEWQQAAKLSG